MQHKINKGKKLANNQTGTICVFKFAPAMQIFPVYKGTIPEGMINPMILFQHLHIPFRCTVCWIRSL